MGCVNVSFASLLRLVPMKYMLVVSMLQRTSIYIV